LGFSESSFSMVLACAIADFVTAAAAEERFRVSAIIESLFD
jgi:hypothetical protein